VPATRGGGDPRREVAVTFGDRRRTEDRVYRFRTAYVGRRRRRRALCGLIGNVEVFKAARESVTIVRSNFFISEFWARRAFEPPCGPSLWTTAVFRKVAWRKCLDLRGLFGV
jgi:3-phenylpropionate/cinnamic acid dioxygenase small subunit